MSPKSGVQTSVHNEKNTAALGVGNVMISRIKRIEYTKN